MEVKNVSDKIKEYDFERYLGYSYKVECRKIVDLEIKYLDICDESVNSFIDYIFSNNKEKYYNLSRDIFFVVLEDFLVDYLNNNSISYMFEPNIQQRFYGESLISINLVDQELIKKLLELTSLNDEEF